MIPKHRKAATSARRTPRPGGYRQLLRWAALPVTNRRWAAPLSAVALGFGLFAGVAIGPGAAGTLATNAAQIIEIPGFSGGTNTGSDGGNEGGGPSAAAASSAGGAPGGGGGSIPSSEPALPSFAPVAASEPESGESTEGPERSPQTESSPPKESSKPEEETLSGVVLHVNPAAGSYTLAEAGGTLDAIHAAKAPQPETKVRVPARLLGNGTFAEAGTRTRSGTRARATFSGTVTYLDPTPGAPAYTVSKRGVSVLVHVHPDPAGAAPALPALGAFANVAVDIERPQPPASTSTSTSPAPVAEPAATSPSEPAQAPAAPAAAPAPATPPGCSPDPSQPPLPAFEPGAVLWQRQVSAEGAPFTYGDFAGIVEAVCADSGQLLVSADDIREDLHDLLFTVPATIDTTKLKVGQSVLATATIGTDGSLALTGLASDERTKGADDAKAAQGDLAPSKPK